MSEWKECKLGDIITLQRGHDLPKTQMRHGIYPVAGSNGIIGYHDSFTTEENGVTIGRSGNIGTPQFYKKKYWAHNTTLYVKDFKGNDPKFIFYFLTAIDFFQFNTGSAVPSLNRNHVHELNVSIPQQLEEQKAIAEVLTSLDDKIDLLHKQNKTLEQLAETLFRHHFIDNAKDDWEEKPLKEVCLIRNGFAFKSESYQESGQKIIRTTNFCNGFVELGNDVVFISDELAQSFNAYHLDRKDFLLVMVGASLGNFAVVTKDILPALQNQNMWCFRAKEGQFQHYLNHAIRIIISENLHGASGSARSFFQKGSFYEQMIRVPDEESLNEFRHLSENLFSRLELNRGQIKSLEKLRDQLLPKLMSGEIDVIKMEGLCIK